MYGNRTFSRSCALGIKRIAELPVPGLLPLAAGAAWGAVFGAIAHSATRGQREFKSISSVEAARYRVEVSAEQASSGAALES